MLVSSFQTYAYRMNSKNGLPTVYQRAVSFLSFAPKILIMKNIEVIKLDSTPTKIFTVLSPLIERVTHPNFGRGN